MAADNARAEEAPSLPPTSELLRLARLIRAGKRVLFVSGSGLSAPSGVPTFRGADGSVWANYVLEWGTRERFEENPREWWNNFWLPAHVVADGSLEIRHYAPNEAHEALATLALENPSVCVITQNIDGLHQRSGVLPRDRLIEVHGSHAYLKCVTNGCRFSFAEVMAAKPLALRRRADGRCELDGEVPRCEACGRPCLPCSLLFDELYESHAFFEWRKATRWMRAAQAVVFVGTSFAVHVTDETLETARSRRVPLFDLNTQPAELPIERSGLPNLDVARIIAGCERTLPRLLEATRCRSAEDECAVLAAGLGTEWHERRDGHRALPPPAQTKPAGGKKRRRQ